MDRVWLDSESKTRCNTFMLFECATITSVSATRLTLQSVRGSACERCARGEGCGGGIIGKLAFRRRPELELEVPHTERYVVGQRVELSVPARRVMALAAVVYLVPLVGLLAGATVGHWLIGTDVAAIVTGAMGFVLTLRVLRGRIETLARRWLSPSITDREESFVE